METIRMVQEMLEKVNRERTLLEKEEEEVEALNQTKIKAKSKITGYFK